MLIYIVHKISSLNINSKRHLLLANFHFSMSNASIPTYRKRKNSAMNDEVAKVCLQHEKGNSVRYYI
jgi:hypothetical protein